MVEITTRSRIPIWRTFGRIQWHVIREPRITLQGAATWWIYCHDSRATCHIAGCSHLAKLMSWSCHIAHCYTTFAANKPVLTNFLYREAESHVDESYVRGISSNFRKFNMADRLISMKNHLTLMKFGELKQILNPVTIGWPKIIFFFKFKMANGRHIKSTFWP